MEKQLKSVQLLSLKEMALRKVAILLWNDRHILNSISEFENPVFHTEENKIEWHKTIEDKVYRKVLKLKLSKSLTKQIMDVVQPVGLEIRRWKEYHEDTFFIDYINLSDWVKFSWTKTGRIDNKRTAESFVRCEALDLHHRYEIACFYCLEDYIPSLWEKLPPKQKRDYKKLKDSSVMSMYFPLTYNGDLSRLDYFMRQHSEYGNLTSVNQWAFEDLIENGYVTPAEYFLKKLTPEERETSLMRCAHLVLTDLVKESYDEERFSSVVWYLLSLMTPQQQMETIQAYPIKVLLCFFHLPLQDIFLENGGLVWACIPETGYRKLLRKMTNKFMDLGHYYPGLFQDFFPQSPPDFKKLFIDVKDESKRTAASNLLDIFFELDDLESIKVIFRNVDEADKVNLVFQRHVLGLFFDFIASDRFVSVEVCLREARLSKGNLERLKEALTRIFRIGGEGAHEYRSLMRFFKLIDGRDWSSDE